MSVEIRIPEVGESVQEAVLAEWFKADGDPVAKDEALFLLETDKITLEVPAEAAGRLKILVAAGATVRIGDVVGHVESGPGAAAPPEQPEPAGEAPAGEAEQSAVPPAASPAVAEEELRPSAAEPPGTGEGTATAAAPGRETLSPAVRRLVAEKGLDPGAIPGTGPGGRLTKGDVLLHLEAGPAATAGPKPAPREQEQPAAPPPSAKGEPTRREPLSPIRKRIAAHLLEAKHATAMLTTFNEVNMGKVLALRKRYREAFEKEHGVKLGLMSFFVRACVVALKAFPRVNARIDAEDIVYHDYCHLGMAVGAERGLVVPVIRHAERLGLAEIERQIREYVDRVKENRLQLADLEGGTFTITNGGVFGSLLSTPILNFPQSAILGLHKIEERPVAVAGQVVIQPMMYLALSYDHRIIDGREAVQFLVRIKEEIEEPDRMLLEV